MNKKNLVAVIATVAVLLPLSLFADSRPQYRTDLTTNTGYGSRYGTFDGIVQDIRSNGRQIILSTQYGTQAISANPGTKVRYRGRNYRVSDLDRGDRIRVTLNGNGRNMKAKSIEVLQSVTDGYGQYGNGSYYPYGYGYPNGQTSSNYYTVYGVVSSVSQWSDRIQVRADNSGRTFWVDGRTTRGVSASQLRVGDRVAVQGYNDRGTFRATDISLNNGYGSYNNGQYQNGQYGQYGNDQYQKHGNKHGNKHGDDNRNRQQNDDDDDGD